MPEGAKNTEFLTRNNGFTTEFWHVVNIELCLPHAPFRKSRRGSGKNISKMGKSQTGKKKIFFTPNEVEKFFLPQTR